MSSQQNGGVETAIEMPRRMTGEESREINKKKLIIRLPFLVETIHNVPVILIELLSRNILHWRERDIILGHASTYDQVVEMCKLIMQGGEVAFHQFVAALETCGDNHVAQELLKPLSREEEEQSLQECVDTLTGNQKKLAMEILEIEIFNLTMSTINDFYFVPTGKIGRLSMAAILSEFTVFNNMGNPMFIFLWKPVTTGIQLANLRLTNILEMCYPAKVGVYRICQNLIGRTIMEVDTEWSVKDIRVGGTYVGRVKPEKSCFYFHCSCFGFWNEYFVMNQLDEFVFHIKSVWKSGNKFEVRNANNQLVATFGKIFAREDKSRVGLKFEDIEFPLTSADRILLLGSAIMAMDRTIKQRAWSPCKMLVLYFILVALLVLIILFLISLFS